MAIDERIATIADAFPARGDTAGNRRLQAAGSTVTGPPLSLTDKSDTGTALGAPTTIVGTVGVNEVQTVTINATGGTFTLTYAAQTTSGIAVNATDAVVQTALEALSNIDVGDVAVVRSGSANAYTYTVTFHASLSSTDVAQITANVTSATHTNEVQSIKIDATGQTASGWTVKYGPTGTPSAGLAFNISTAALKTAIEGLTGWPAGGTVTVTGGPGNAGGTTPYVVTFGGTLASTDVLQLTCANGDLTGGAATATGTTTTPGVAPSFSDATSPGGAGPKGGITYTYVNDAGGATVEISVLDSNRKLAVPVVSAAASPVTISGLTLGNTYDVYFRTVTTGGRRSTFAAVDTRTITA